MAIKVSKPEINIREKLTELDFDKVPFQKMPAGSVLQVAQKTDVGAYGTSNTTATALGTYVDITPLRSNSKILIQVASTPYAAGTAHFWIYKDGAALSGRFQAGNTTTGTTIYVPVIATMDENCGTTSSIRYEVYGLASSGGSAYITPGSTDETLITAMEIAQ